ncbi:MAG: hypothetical protein HBSAPP03_00590 [Phycisphaerae bacterium]|nr:MAG: hypothetical protein HBSAPP03_00590 [Phycisphaerae bacterium]
MATFRFRFEAVLSHRRAQEQRAQREVAVLERERARVEEAIRAFQRGALAARDDLREHLAAGGCVDLRAVRLQAGASLHLVHKAQRAVLELAGVHKRLEAARLDLLRAAMRRKAVEALRERRWEAWVQDHKRRETAELDELMVMRAGRAEDES